MATGSNAKIGGSGSGGDQIDSSVSWFVNSHSDGGDSSRSSAAAVINSSGTSSSISLRGRVLGGDHLMHTSMGNFNYSPPEALIKAGYDHTVDWWSVGILMFHFLAGITPFEGETAEITLENIVSGRLKWNLLRNYGHKSSSDIGNISERRRESSYGPIALQSLNSANSSVYNSLVIDANPNLISLEGSSNLHTRSLLAATSVSASISLSVAPILHSSGRSYLPIPINCIAFIWALLREKSKDRLGFNSSVSNKVSVL
jgi:hypothetical protein